MISHKKKARYRNRQRHQEFSASILLELRQLGYVTVWISRRH